MKFVKSFADICMGPNVIKLFTIVIHLHSMVIPSFCVIKLYYLDNYRGMAVIYHSKKLITWPTVANINTAVLTLEDVGTAVNYCSIFITLAHECRKFFKNNF
jgi:hypothetical protein